MRVFRPASSLCRNAAGCSPQYRTFLSAGSQSRTSAPRPNLLSLTSNLLVPQLNAHGRFQQARSCSTQQRVELVDDAVRVQVGRALYPVKNEDDLGWALKASKQDLPALVKALEENETKAKELRAIKEDCGSLATRKASRLAYASIFFFTSELALMTYGTYFVYSWDIMEPLSYLLGLVDVIGGYGFYAYYRANYSADDLAASFKKSVIKKAYRKHQFEEAELDALEEQIENLRRRILVVKSI